MGKNSNKEKVDVQLQQAQQRATEDRNAWNAVQTSERAEASDRQREMYGVQFEGLKRLSEQGALSDEDSARFRGLMGAQGEGGGGGGGGGYSAGNFMPDMSGMNEMEKLYRESITGGSVNQPNLRKGMGTLEEIQKTGGYSPEQLAGIGGDIGTLRSIGASGGVDPTGQYRMRGMGVFDEYAKTGGLSESDRGTIRAKGNLTIPAFYDSLRREGGRQARLTGTNAGQAALSARLGRDQALGAQEAALNTEMGLLDRINQGRQFGATNAAQSEAGLQALMSGNRLRATEGSIAGQRGISEYMTGARAGAAKEVGDVEQEIQNTLLGERQYGMGGLEKIIQERMAQQAAAASQAAAANAASSAQSSADWRDRMGLEQYLLETDLAGQQFGLEGMGNLYRSAPAEIGMRDANILAGYGLSQSGDVNRTGLQLQRGENQSGWGTFGNILGTAAGIAGSVYNPRPKGLGAAPPGSSGWQYNA